MNRLPFLIAGILIFATSCQKDPWTEDPTKLKDLTEQEFIESSVGGTIELQGGTSITVPSGALSEDEEIQISTFTPTVENIYDEGLEDFASTISFSQIVRLEPAGLTFDKPVEVKIPLVQSWIPDWVTDDMLVGLIISGDEVDSLPVTFDRENNVASVETTHFSTLVISMKRNSNIEIRNALIAQNTAREDIILSFDVELLNNDGETLKNDDFNFNSTDYSEGRITYSFFKIKLYQNRKVGYDILLSEVFLLKIHADCSSIYIDPGIIGNAELLRDRLESFDRKKKKREFDGIIKTEGCYSKEGSFFGGYVFARFDGDENIIGDIQGEQSISNLNEQNGFDFITTFTDRNSLPFDLFDLSSLEEDKEYQIKIDILIEGSKSGFHGESKKSNKFTLSDLGSVLDVTTPPKAVITSPPNNSEFFFGETIRLQGYGQDKEDGRITSSLSWSYIPIGGGAGVSINGNSINTIPVGHYRLYLTVTDRSDLTGTTWHQVTIKNNKPEVKITSPSNVDDFYVRDQISFKGTITDKEDNPLVQSRIIWKSNIQGVIKTGQLQYSINNLKFGTHKITLEYTDGHGEKEDDEITLNIGSRKPVVTIHGPTNNSSWTYGTIIGFRGSATDPEGNLDDNSYRWYSNVDGEITDGRGKKDFGYSGLSKGIHQITLKVNDNDQVEGEDTHTITITDEENHSPVAKLEVSPPSGKIETTFTFDASKSTDSEDPLSKLQFRWDFNNDWEWEIDYSSNHTVTQTFSEEGTYKIWVEVKDTKGAETKTSVEIVVSKDNTPPTALFSISPSSGTTSTNFQFDASGCSDEETSTSQLQVRWDWTNDGEWDTNYSTIKTESYQFPSAGTYSVKLEVKDEGGFTGTVIKDISVTSGGTGGDGSFEYYGRTYEYKTIGTQTWMAENLAYLPSVSPSSEDSFTEAYCYVYGYQGTSVSEAKATENFEKYGVLYNWPAAMDGDTLGGQVQGICPIGWHLPSDEEWKILERHLGMDLSDLDELRDRDSGNVGFKLKSTSDWHEEEGYHGIGDNSSGFNAKPAGLVNGDIFCVLQQTTFFFSASEYYDYSAYAWGRELYWAEDGIARRNLLRRSGCSIRCLKN